MISKTQHLLLETKYSNKRACWGSFTLSVSGTFCHPKHKFYPVGNSMPTFPGPGRRSSYSELRLLWIKVIVNINVLSSSVVCTLSSFECILRSRKSASNGTSMYHCVFPVATLRKLSFSTSFPAHCFLPVTFRIQNIKPKVHEVAAWYGFNLYFPCV